MIQAKFGLNWPVVSEEKIFFKVYRRTTTPSDGNSAQRWAKKGNNSKMGNGIYFKIAGYVDLDMLHIFAI
jgi:hypothetical protein